LSPFVAEHEASLGRAKNPQSGVTLGGIARDVQFRILGPLEVIVGSEAVALGGRRSRALLALLLLNRSELVSRARLVDEVWGERPPKAVDSELRVYVAKLRKALDADALVRRADGYALIVDDAQLDAARFERLATEGRRLLAAGAAERATATLREALALWRGPVLADLAHEQFTQGEARRLEELRLAALEERVEADLALGRHLELVGQLERLVVEHPFRERLCAQLMLALYRCGRQVDALEHYRRTAKLLVEELGLEPGPELRSREHAILGHEPGLRLAVLAEPNLPSPPGRLIGRARELDEIEALVSQPETRLVTLTGPGGSGKTRLALEVAARLADGLSRPVFFVELAALEEAGAVLPAVAAAVGHKEDARVSLQKSLRAFLRNRRLLLVLDNFEHVIDAAADVAALLAGVPGLTALATSRSPLRVRAEWRYDVGPLRGEDAEALFLERAAAIRRFVPSAAVPELCRRLDCLPLAIELAAARFDRLTPEEILAGLDRRFDVLTDGARDLPARQRTLHATVDWSYGLLADAERELFVRLAVFVGGCTTAAAERIAGATPDTIAALGDAALIRHDNDRLTMLETVREYALERLLASRGEAELRRAHARYYGELVQTSASALGSPAVLATVAADHENVRAALRWSRDAERDLHLRLVPAAAPFWSIRGYLKEADAWLRPAVAIAASARPAVRARVLTAAAGSACRLGDLARADELVVEALNLWRELGDESGAAAALAVAMMSAARAGDLARRGALLEEFATAAAHGGDSDLRAVALRVAGAGAGRAGDHEHGRTLVEESLRLACAAGNEKDVGQALCHLGVVALQAGRYDDAREPLEESLRIAQRLAYAEAAAYSLSGLAALAVAQDDVAQAAQLLAAADALLDELGTTRLPFISDLDGSARAAVISSIGDEAFTRARDQARRATLDEVISGATAAVPVPPC